MRFAAWPPPAGRTVKREDHYQDRYNNSLDNGLVLRDSAGKPKMLIAQDGSVIVDPYYMGYDHQQFLQDYAADHITQKAMLNGACTQNMGLDKQGNLVLEVTYA